MDLQDMGERQRLLGKMRFSKTVMTWYDESGAMVKQIEHVFPATNPIPRGQWPIWAKALAQFAKPEDKGIGDVCYRLYGPENSEKFKRWFKAATGKDCGCAGRQARYNLQYPL